MVVQLKFSFSSIRQIRYVEVRISRSISGSRLDFEITVELTVCIRSSVSPVKPHSKTHEPPHGKRTVIAYVNRKGSGEPGHQPEPMLSVNVSGNCGLAKVPDTH